MREALNRAWRQNVAQVVLRFRGRPYSQELAQLARATGGQAIEVSADDPTSLLEPFADALTRSQGYEAELLTPASPELAAHRGARRVRLPAVAPGDGPALDFSIAGPRSRSPQLGPVETGTHRYRDGDTYRYAALDYRPVDEPVTVRVTGAGDWKVVAPTQLQDLLGEPPPAASPETSAWLLIGSATHRGRTLHLALLCRTDPRVRSPTTCPAC